MKKIVALLASKRHANTYGLLLQIKALLAENDMDLTIIELYGHEICDCRGCEACIRTGRCVLQDDAAQIMAELAAADGVILASPVYLQQVSGKMKTFFDRTCSWYHRPVLTAKPVLCVATTKGSGLRATLATLENAAAQWGAVPAGRVGRSIFTLAKPVTRRELRAFVRLVGRPQSYRPPLRRLIDFEVQKSLALYLSGLDADYWKKQGWADKSYFYPCRVLPLRRALSGAVGAAMRRGMAKTPPQNRPRTSGSAQH